MSKIDIVFVSGPTYVNNGDSFLLPFTYSSGTLNLPLSTAEAYPSGSEETLGNDGANIRVIGGLYPTLSLGTNLRNFIKNKVWDGYTVTGSASSIAIVSAGTVTKVQQLMSKFLSPNWDQKSYNVSPNTWDFANFIGPPSVYLFTKPLVVQVAGSNATTGYSGPICITFQTYWDK